jgi:hypothetical protein
MLRNEGGGPCARPFSLTRCCLAGHCRHNRDPMPRLLIALLLLASPLAAQAEMDVQRGGNSIADGGNDSVTNTGTSPFNLTYTIRNDGAAALNLTDTPEVAISAEVNCTVSVISAPVTPVAASGTTTFIVQVSPQSAAAFSFALSIANDDVDENPYDFTFNANPAAPKSGNDGDGSKDGGCSTAESGRGRLMFAALLLLGFCLLRRSPTASCRADR